MDGLRIRMLGPVAADVDGVPADLGGPRQRAVLALLLVARGEVVSVDRIVEDLWRGEPPPRATGALQAYVSNLRRALEPGRPPRAPARVLISASPGYALRLPPQVVDAWRFETLLRSAGDAADPVAAFSEALDLWRGEALAEFEGESWARPEATRLAELRVAAREGFAAALLADGRSTDAVVAAEALVRDAPLREEGWRLLALGQYSAGRQADALASLREARRLLSDELGIDPGPRLVALEADVLAQRVVVAERPATRAAAPAVEHPHGPGAAGDGFVGRRDELAALRGAAAAAARGQPAVATVSGEAGGGKSALLGRLVDGLREQGWRVGLGRCPESDGGPPAWAWAEVLRALAAEVDPGEHRQALAPLLTDDAPPAAEDALTGRFHLHRAVGDWLATLDDRPLAIVLDDLHRADAETRALLAGVAARGDGRLLLVCAYRPEPGAPVEDLLAALARHRPTRVHLTGLGGADVAELITLVTGRPVDPATVEALAERTAGNPFYLTESARLLASEGELIARAEVPEGVRDVLRRRFARLPEETVSVLRLAAVVGRDVDVALLTRAAEAAEDAVLDALEVGVISGLLVEPDPGVVRFSHLLVRDALYAGIPRLRRTRWHQRIADAVRELYPHDLSALAHHAALAATPHTAVRAADDCAAAAAPAERRYAHDAASALYRRALDCLDLAAGPVPPARRVRLLTDLIRAQLLSGATAAVAQARQEAVAVAEAAGDDALLVEAIVAWNVPLPWSSRRYGQVDPAYVARVERLLAGDVPTPAQRCRLLCVLVRETSHSGDPRTRAAADEAVRLARRTDDPELLALALQVGVDISIPDLDVERYRRLGEALFELAEQHGLSIFRVLARLMRAQAAVVAGDVAGAEEWIAEATDLATRYQLRQALSVTGMLRAMIAVLRGDLATAEAAYEETTDLMDRAGAVDTAGIRMLGLVSVRVNQRRLAELTNLLRSLVDVYGGPTRDLLALSLLEVGDEQGAARLVTPQPPYVLDYMWTMFTTTRALVVARVGDRAEQDELYAALLPHADLVAGIGSAGFVTTPIARALADLAGARGDRDRQRAHLEHARTVAQRYGCAPWIAQLDAELAQV